MNPIEKFLANIPLNELYKDLFKPGMQKAGEALASVIDISNLVLFPINWLNGRSRIYLEKNLERYSAKLNSQDTLTLTEVPQFVGGPILNKLTYLDQNELSEAFINLLTKASFEESLNLVHPVYLTILEKLSADEAKILAHYANHERLPFIEVYVHRFKEEVPPPDEKAVGKAKLQQSIDYTYQNREHTYIKALWNTTGIEKEVELLYPENINIYIENLTLNGLFIFERENYHSSDEKVYDKFTRRRPRGSGRRGRGRRGRSASSA